MTKGKVTESIQFLQYETVVSFHSVTSMQQSIFQKIQRPDTHEHELVLARSISRCQTWATSPDFSNTLQPVTATGLKLQISYKPPKQR